MRNQTHRDASHKTNATRTTHLGTAPLSDGILRSSKVMMVSPFVLLLMMIRVACNLVLRLGAQRDILATAPVDRCSLSGPQLPIGIDEEALQTKSEW